MIVRHLMRLGYDAGSFGERAAFPFYSLLYSPWTVAYAKGYVLGLRWYAANREEMDAY